MLVTTAGMVFLRSRPRDALHSHSRGVSRCWSAVSPIDEKPYRLARVVNKLDPKFVLVDKIDKHGWIRAQMKKTITARDTNYQIEQAKIAVGSGGPAGVGLMQGRQKLFYLPEAHTDMILCRDWRRVRPVRGHGGADRVPHYSVARHPRVAADSG